MSRQPQQRKPSARGFTLIEVMVGMVLLALMGVLLMTTINSSVNAKETVDEISGRYHLVRQALTRMTQEISMAYLSKHINVVDPAYVTQFKGQRDYLYFSAFGNVVRQKDAKQSDQQVIGFYLGTDREGKTALMRRAHPNLNLDVERKEGHAQVLCPHVTKLEFQYYDGKEGTWGEFWLSDPLLLTNQGQIDEKLGEEGKALARANQPKQWRLPAYVKIFLTVEMAQGTEMTWVTQAEIPIQDPLDLK